MNRGKEDIEKRVEAHLSHLGQFDSPPAEDMARSRERTLDRLVTTTATSTKPAIEHSVPPNWKWRPAVVTIAAAAAVIVAVGVATMWQSADNPLFRVADGKVHPQGSTIRANGGVGAVLALVDGSRVEMRAGSELSLARGDDGLRILLTTGGIIVHAAKQGSGHLYVQTKDVTVSVVGTVFLVNAEKQGSRVAVIEGEVLVQQGANEKRLLPGEQVTSSPAMSAPPVRQVIAWSRNAAALDALLPAVVTQSATQTVAPAKPAFEVISIRSAGSAPAGGGRGAGGLPNYAPYIIGCSGVDFTQLDPGRLSINYVTLLTLILRAYGPADRNCTAFTSQSQGLTGGPAWVYSEQFNVEARIPQGTPVYTLRQFENNNAPVLQAMLRTALEDRFKLVVRRETKDLPVEILKLGTTRDAAQLTELAALTMSRSPRKAEWDGLFARAAQGLETLKEGLVSTEGDGLWGINASMSEVVSYLGRLTGKPVLDRTSLTVRLMFHLNYDRVPDGLGGIQGFFRPLAPASMTNLRRALREQLGLELESGTAPVEVLVIERIERPTEN
jgi:uncharacterized protein (TIGR03435 family)